MTRPDLARSHTAVPVPKPQPTHSDAVLAAAARELSDELTIILSAVDLLLQKLDRSRLQEIQLAAEKSAAAVARMLDYSTRRGAKPSAASLESLVERGQ